MIKIAFTLLLFVFPAQAEDVKKMEDIVKSIPSDHSVESQLKMLEILRSRQRDRPARRQDGCPGPNCTLVAPILPAIPQQR